MVHSPQERRSDHATNSESTGYGGISGRGGKQVTEGGQRIVDGAQSLDLSPKTLGNWVRRTRAGPALSTGGPLRGVTDVQAEVSRLRTENAQLSLDKELLKKAAESSTGRCNTGL